MEINASEKLCREIRRDIVEMVWKAGSGHIGGALSAVEILAALYFAVLAIRPDDPKWPARDRFVLSKGHSAIGLYAVLARRGFFDCRLLFTEFIRAAGRLQEHPEMRKIPGIEISSGSLGQGISAAAGMAYGLRLKKIPARVFCLMGCGEQQEGQVWEAAMTAAHHRLGGLAGIIDYNRLQVSGAAEQVMEVEPLDAKWKAFGWDVYQVEGHDLAALTGVLKSMRARPQTGKPAVLIARTVKGKGVDFMENNPDYHAASFTEEQYQNALASINRRK